MKWFKHKLAEVETTSVGEGTRIWAFAHVLAGARIGASCNICDQTFIENDVTIGDRVTIKCGVQLWDGVTLGDDVFVGPNVTFTNDKFPRSRCYEKGIPRTVIETGASIGANATILPGITIGEWAVVGAGAVVTRNVPAFSIVVGNPARITGYVGSKWTEQAFAQPAPESVGQHAALVDAVTIYRWPAKQDMRGLLSAGEGLPFEVKRYFLVYQVPSREVRGEHAHHALHQFLVCVHGECRLIVDDAHQRQEISLNAPTLGVHVPPMVWTVQYHFSSDAVLMVLASDIYRPDDYIRDYEEFRKLRGSSGRTAQPS